MIQHFTLDFSSETLTKSTNQNYIFYCLQKFSSTLLANFHCQCISERERTIWQFVKL